MVSAYYRRLTGDDEITRMSAAKAWSMWEGRASTLLPKSAVVDHFANPFTALSLARIECHYFMNDSFLEQDEVLNNADRLRDIPGVIVHGRYDVVCPLEQAWALHKAWPQSHLQVIADAGHSATEPGIVDALVAAPGFDDCPVAARHECAGFGGRPTAGRDRPRLAGAGGRAKRR
jgi:proline iminopeptidase